MSRGDVCRPPAAAGGSGRERSGQGREQSTQILDTGINQTAILLRTSIFKNLQAKVGGKEAEREQKIHTLLGSSQKGNQFYRAKFRRCLVNLN